MGLPVPKSDRMSYLKARYELESGNCAIEEILTHIARCKTLSVMLTSTYNYEHDKHIKLLNRVSVHKTGGCGCKICNSLQAYVSAKIYLHIFKKSFYDDYSMMDGHNLFDSKYLKYKENLISRNYNLDKAITEKEYFEFECNKLEEKIQELRVKYKSIVDTVNSLLEA